MAATWLVGLVNLLGLNGAVTSISMTGNWPNFDSSIRVALILLLLLDSVPGQILMVT